MVDQSYSGPGDRKLAKFEFSHVWSVLLSWYCLAPSGTTTGMFALSVSPLENVGFTKAKLDVCVAMVLSVSVSMLS